MFIAIAVFVLIYIAIASEQFPRHWTALLGGGTLILFGVLSPMEAFRYISWDTIGLLAGMFVLVAILHEAGFFTWLAMAGIRRISYRPAYLFVVLIILAALLAMFIDSITVMLFLAALTLPLCRLLKLDPVPIIIAEVCAANTGGAATLVGDPPNVILGTALGFNFADFAAHTGPISAVAALLLLLYFYLTNRKALKDAHDALDPATIQEIEALHHEPVHAHLTRVGIISLLSAVILLILHIPLSELTGVHISGAMAALVPACLALASLQPGERKNVLRRVDGENLLFFAGLFVLIGGLEKVNVFEAFASVLAQATGDSHPGLILALHWGPGLASGVLDNVPLALAMSFVLHDLAGMPGTPALALMVWSLALGVDIGGNLTPIGASANVVAYTFMERHHGPVGWKRWVMIAAPPTVFVMFVASALLVLKGSIGWY